MEAPKPAEPKPTVEKTEPKQTPAQDPRDDIAQEKKIMRQGTTQGNGGTSSEAVKDETTSVPEKKAESIVNAGGVPGSDRSTNNRLFTPIADNSDAAYETMTKADVPSGYASMAASGLKNANAIHNAMPTYMRMAPVLGTAIDAYELKTGKDVFTEKKLTTTDKVLTSASLGVSLIPGAKALTVVAHADEIGDTLRVANKLEDAVAGASEVKYVNIDTGTANAFISEGSPIRGQLKSYVNGKQMVMTDTAVSEFKNIVNGVGGPLEQARAGRFLNRVQVIPDNPSARVLGLQTTKKVGANDIKIFGTGDNLGITTMTSDAKFVRGAQAQGVDFDTFIHDPVSLTKR